MLLNLRDPVADGLEGTTVGDVVHKEDPLGSAEIGSGDRPKTFLAGSIPNLKLDLCAINVNILDLKINPDSSTVYL